MDDKNAPKMESSSDQMQSESKGKQISITVNRDTVMNAVIGIQFVLLLVFGWQIVEIKEQLEDGTVLAGNNPTQVAQPTPSAAGDSGAPAAPPARVDIALTDADHTKGPKNAPVTIVEYSDFECPYCSAASPTIEQILAEYGDQVSVTYRHFPLSFHRNAQKAGEASECAADQGKFWEYHDIMFENQDLLALGTDQLKKWAGEIGLNVATFNNCLDSDEKANDVRSDFTEGAGYGVTGTPAFFVNGTKLSGALPFANFKQVIDAELASAN